MKNFVIDKSFEVIPDYFKLVVLVAYRAKEISSGSPALVPKQGDKSPIIALREIAEHEINENDLEEAVIRSFQHYIYLENTQEEDDD